MESHQKLNFDLYKDLMDEHIQRINTEIEENDKFFKELKTHFDKVKDSYTSGSLGFIAKQTPALVSLKGNKVQLLKELTNVQKIIIDSTLKTKIEENDDSGVNQKILKEIHHMIMHPNDEKYLELVENDDYIEENNDDNDEIDYDEEFNKRLKEIDNDIDESEEINNSNEEDEEELEFNIVCDLERNLYIVDEDYNIIDPEEYGLEIPDWIIEFEEDEDGEIICAYNQDDEEIEVIDFDEDD